MFNETNYVISQIPINGGDSMEEKKVPSTFLYLFSLIAIHRLLLFYMLYQWMSCYI